MQIVYLCLVFLTIILFLALKRPLYQAILAGLTVTALAYQIPPMEIVRRTTRVLTKWSSLSVLLSLYLITFLQRILEARSQIRLAQEDLNGIFHNRRINTAGACLFIGLLPSAASMLLCSDIVKNATDGYLDPADQAFTASWFRHIPESTLPTYTAVLLMLNLAGVEISRFLAGMVVPVITLAALGYGLCLRKIPSAVDTAQVKTAAAGSETAPATADAGSRAGRRPWTGESLRTSAKGHSRIQDCLRLFQHLWSLILILVLILALGFQVVTAVLVSILLAVLVYRVTVPELKHMVSSAIEVKMLVNTFLVLVLKEFIAYTGVLGLLPEAMAALPLPTYLIFAVLFFAATIISGSTGAIALATPLAFAAMPGGMPLMVYLMCICHAASQVSPTHICLVVASDYFHISLGQLVRKTLPVSLVFCGLMTLYYQGLLALGI